MLSEFGIVTAFEHDAGALEMARKKGTCKIEQGTLPQATPDYSDPFDLVVAFDVIEHVKEDVESLKKLRSTLKPNGKMVMTVPAFPFLWSKHDEIHHHFRRYTRPQLTQNLRDAGFEVEYISYFNSLLFPVVIAMRFAKNILGMEETPDDGMPPKGLNRILHSVFSSERHWIGKISVPFGVSLVAVAQNPALDNQTSRNTA